MMSEAAERARKTLSPGHPLIAHIADQERQMQAAMGALINPERGYFTHPPGTYVSLRTTFSGR